MAIKENKSMARAVIAMPSDLPIPILLIDGAISG